MKKFLLTVVLFVFTTYAGAADFILPKQRILGAEEPIPLGELVMLSVSEMEEKPKYLDQAKYKWKIFENGKERTTGIRFYDNNVFFGSGVRPKKMIALVSASYLYVVREDDKQDGNVKEFGLLQNFFSVEIVIGDGPPGPDPEPPVPPNPDPEPNFPEGKFGLTKFTYNLVKNVNLLPAERVRLCQALANSFTSIVKQIDDGKITDLKHGLVDAEASNAKALGDKSTAFKPFGLALQKFLFEQYSKGTLRTAKDLGVAFLEVSTGLSAVK